MPNLPDGPRRDFVENLFWYHRKAHRPTLQEISDRLRERGDLAGTASKETIRKMLHGETVPQRWENAKAVFLVLCEFGGIDPDTPVAEYYDAQSHLEQYHELWNKTFDEPEAPNRQLEDPWGSLPDGEPPF